MDTLDDGSPASIPDEAESRALAWERLWPLIDAVPGWLTETQARLLHDAVRALPPGATVVEIGSHRGRSTLALATARPDVRVVAIDPFIRTRLLPGAVAEQELRANLTRFGVADHVDVRPMTSRAARRSWRGEIDLLWIDGKHDVVSLLSDLRWTRVLRAGEQVLIHDAFSSVGVTIGLILDQCLRRRIRYLDRSGSLARFVHASPTSQSRLAFARSLPWWVRNVAIKVLLRLRLTGMARVCFGHIDRFDPF